MNVSVIIPARDAADTIVETLASLRAQTFREWEAIVVDDGSIDSTATEVRRAADDDPRVRLVRQAAQGVSVARNTGVAAARHEWILFLDADDWIALHHLERMTDALSKDPARDAVHCGWARVAADGATYSPEFCPPDEDLFPHFARRCAFAMHACIVRRRLVQEVGGFDPALRPCQDWDLWQRIARTGARFTAVHEVLALYRTHRASGSQSGSRLLANGLVVLSRGHAPDPRVPRPVAKYANGYPTDGLPFARYYLVCWAAGLVIGAGDDARPILDLLDDQEPVTLAPTQVAEMLYRSVPCATGRHPSAWLTIWRETWDRVRAFLESLRERTGTPELARRTGVVLEAMILDGVSQRPASLEATHAVAVEVTMPIPAVQPPSAIERVRCDVTVEGERLGALTLPACDGVVPAALLADAIAARFAWEILGRYFARTLYPTLAFEPAGGKVVVRRGDLLLAEVRGDAAGGPRHGALHDCIGWVCLLQEVCARPGWSQHQFYDPRTPEPSTVGRRCDEGWLEVELGEPLSDVVTAAGALELAVLVGGAPIGVVTITRPPPRIAAQAIRAALLTAARFELCRAVVREALLGRPFGGGGSLRDRLVGAAGVARARRGTTGASLEGPTPDLPPCAGGALCGALDEGASLALARRSPAVFGGEGERRPRGPSPTRIDVTSGAVGRRHLPPERGRGEGCPEP